MSVGSWFLAIERKKNPQKLCSLCAELSWDFQTDAILNVYRGRFILSIFMKSEKDIIFWEVDPSGRTALLDSTNRLNPEKRRHFLLIFCSFNLIYKEQLMISRCVN